MAPARARSDLVTLFRIVGTSVRDAPRGYARGPSTRMRSADGVRAVSWARFRRM